MANDLKHYGVLGMRWGHRKAAGNVTKVNVGRGPVGRLKEAAGLAVDATRDDINRVKGVAKKVVNSKAFKTFVYDKDNVTGIIFKKDQVEKLRSKLSKIGTGLKDSFNKFQVEDHDFTVAAFKNQIQRLRKSENPKDHKVANDLEKEIKAMEDDLNSVFSPEELKKYRGF